MESWVSPPPRQLPPSQASTVSPKEEEEHRRVDAEGDTTCAMCGLRYWQSRNSETACLAHSGAFHLVLAAVHVTICIHFCFAMCDIISDTVQFAVFMQTPQVNRRSGIMVHGKRATLSGAVALCGAGPAAPNSKSTGEIVRHSILFPTAPTCLLELVHGRGGRFYDCGCEPRSLGTREQSDLPLHLPILCWAEKANGTAPPLVGLYDGELWLNPAICVGLEWIRVNPAHAGKSSPSPLQHYNASCSGSCTCSHRICYFRSTPRPGHDAIITISCSRV